MTEPAPKRSITIAGRRFELPRSRSLRILIGGALVVGGVFGFLPVLGFWMIPLGVAVLAADLPFFLRLKRRAVIAYGRRFGGAKQGLKAERR